MTVPPDRERAWCRLPSTKTPGARPAACPGSSRRPEPLEILETLGRPGGLLVRVLLRQMGLLSYSTAGEVSGASRDRSRSGARLACAGPSPPGCRVRDPRPGPPALADAPQVGPLTACATRDPPGGAPLGRTQPRAARLAQAAPRPRTGFVLATLSRRRMGTRWSQRPEDLAALERSPATGRMGPSPAVLSDHLRNRDQRFSALLPGSRSAPGHALRLARGWTAKPPWRTSSRNRASSIR